MSNFDESSPLRQDSASSDDDALRAAVEAEILLDLEEQIQQINPAFDDPAFRGPGTTATPPPNEEPPPRTNHRTGRSDRRPAAALILDHLHAVYQPTFRRGDRIWSATLRTEVRRGEALARGCDSLLMATLVAQAVEMPRDGEGRVRANAAPKVYREWVPVAWADLLGSLAEEPEADEIEPAARADFRHRLARSLTRLVTLQCGDRVRKDDQDHREARSVLHWCLRFGKAGPWRQIRSYFVWCRLEPNQADPHEALRVALRPELFGQLQLHDLEQLGPDEFTNLAERYGCGQRCRAGRGGTRALALTPEWLRSLLDEPEGDGGREPGEEG
jgi:hypothetical protein